MSAVYFHSNEFPFESKRKASLCHVGRLIAIVALLLTLLDASLGFT
jgi:hypothetical protein